MNFKQEEIEKCERVIARLKAEGRTEQNADVWNLKVYIYSLGGSFSNEEQKGSESSPLLNAPDTELEIDDMKKKLREKDIFKGEIKSVVLDE